MSEQETLQEAEGLENQEKSQENSEETQPSESPAKGDESTSTTTSEEVSSKDESSNKTSEKVDMPDYDSYELEALVETFESLLKSDQIQHIRSQVSKIKNAFNAKFSRLLEEKKAAFLEEGGNSIDFRFSSPLKRQFNTLSKTFREKQQAFQKQRTESHKQNLEIRLQIIEEIKGLINVETNINTTYNTFKNLQERWRNTGSIPPSENNNVWNNYRHHVEIFYDFLHLNRDLRELDFKHNLEQKQKIIQRAQELDKETNLPRAFRELQALHKIWKEELGPVSKKHKDRLWEEFSNATKAINDKRKNYYKELEATYETNLEFKNNIISKIQAISEKTITTHSQWQKSIKEIEALRQSFISAGKVPSKQTESTWSKFKEVCRTFNKNKNAYYKNLKKNQVENLLKKRELVDIAEQNKDNDDLTTTLELMKNIQKQWKNIGHIPRKDSQKLWKQFQSACNHFFDRFHEQRATGTDEEITAYETKKNLLEELNTIELSKTEKEEQLEIIKSFSDQWYAAGRVAHGKRYINKKFYKIIEGLYDQMGYKKSELELLKYDNKLSAYAEDQHLLNKEINFVRKKIDEGKSEINQLENNLQFFSNIEESNPLVREVHQKIEKHKQQLLIWKNKYSKIKKLLS
jgi:hypothetical protein